MDRIIVGLFDGSDWEQLIASNKPLFRKELFFRLLELANAATVADEKQKFVFFEPISFSADDVVSISSSTLLWQVLGRI